MYNLRLINFKESELAKVVTLAMLLNAKAEVTSLEQDKDFLKAKEAQLKNETDDEIMTRLKDRFEILDDMTRAVKKGDVRAMIVTGPPGVGKSFGVERVLSKHDVFANVAQDGKLKKYEYIGDWNCSYCKYKNVCWGNNP